ncbi:YifB family Mg chelatase-like AAA ATPase [Vibrio profundum]|uniref:YifB family Mg chelatase-like AAA ATPase n=1 Tax=Vibrio profundum TaxID=2910247 RepID=UPI003D12F876
MGLAVIYSRACVGVESPQVTVEVHISNGMPGFCLVGLPETTVKESRDRVRSAIINSRFEFPSKRITVNLAPADLPKEGGRFDLPIALGILLASAQVTCADIEQREFIGELALSGELRPVKGVLPAALAANNANRSLLVPHDNGDQAALVGKECHQSAQTLLEVCADLLGQQKLGLYQSPPRETVKTHSRDLCDIIGQQQGKRALEIAAAGSHNLLFLGPPGTGKTMLASRLCDLLPEMSDAEALETASIASLTQQEITANNWKQRPFRTPHHSSSMAALVGGGTVPRPGEISLAHNGLLFLDELPEFEKKVLDSLRQPLEAGEIVISRAQGKTRFPARFQLVGALNPSPTGYYEDHQSQANPQMVLRYLSRLSGPLLDRFDMSVEIPALPKGTLAQGGERGDNTSTVKQRVINARQRMSLRGTTNALLTSQQLDKYCPLDQSDAEFLEAALHRLGLSVRAYHRIIKVARTIADLEDCVQIQRAHLAEALGYRAMDRLLLRMSANAVTS